MRGKGYVMLIEDWLRGCVHHDGRHGEVTLKCERVLAIADYIESTRNKVEVVRCKNCKRFDPDTGLVGLGICEIHEGITAEYGFCHHGKRKDGEQDDTIR